MKIYSSPPRRNSYVCRGSIFMYAMYSLENFIQMFLVSYNVFVIFASFFISDFYVSSFPVKLVGSQHNYPGGCIRRCTELMLCF